MSRECDEYAGTGITRVIPFCINRVSTEWRTNIYVWEIYYVLILKFIESIYFINLNLLYSFLCKQ